MKITRLHLRNVRCFENLDLDLRRGSALIIGDNGDGKSTIMRSLAMGLCDQSSASALFRELYGEYVRHNSQKPQATITVDLADARGRRYRIETIIRSLDTFERVEQKVYIFDGKRPKKVSQDDFPWDRIFASGYGAGVRVHGSLDVDAYLAVDAVYPLFKYDQPLQNPELVLRRIYGAEQKRHGKRKADALWRRIQNLLRTILQLKNEDRIEFKKAGLVVQGSWGTEDLRSLGDGYRSTVTWVLDLLSWWFVRWQGSRKRFDLDSVSGIVLIDEIEQHLHPRWQRNIIRLLRESFPQVQFIATTHSPLVASGCEGVPVHKLQYGEHNEVAPFGWLAEDVYELMGLPSSRAKPFEMELEEYARLDEVRLARKLTKAEQVRLGELRRRLSTLPGDDPIRLATELENLAKRAKELVEPQS